MSDLFASAALSVSELNRLAKSLLEDNPAPPAGIIIFR